MLNRNYRPSSSYYVSKNTSVQEIEAMEELDRINAQDEPAHLCWSVPIPGCSASRFIDIFFMDSKFCVNINSQYAEYSVEDIQPCEVPGKPEIVARIGKIGLTAERRDALLKMAGVEGKTEAEDDGSSTAKVRKSKKQISPVVVSMQLPEGKKARLVRGRLVIR